MTFTDSSCRCAKLPQTAKKKTKLLNRQRLFCPIGEKHPITLADTACPIKQTKPEGGGWRERRLNVTKGGSQLDGADSANSLGLSSQIGQKLAA